MIYTLLVLASPISGSSARSAVHFVRAAIARGHQVNRVFFLDEGADSGNANAVFPQDENDLTELWRELAIQHNVELVLCVSSALKRGMLDSTEASRYEKPASTIFDEFEISGLGQLIDAAGTADRLLTFGG